MATRRVSFALQGGGSHGAFTWGVLDRLLEHGGFELEGLSGASAGAVNAVLLAHGFTCGGAQGAREALRRFWQSLPPIAPQNPYLYLARFYSPYQLNPFNLNPLRDLLAAQVDFERLRRECPQKLFVAATRVDSGVSRVFTTGEIGMDTVLASCCVPRLHHSVKIDGVDYWDGGLTANPPIRQLIYECTAPEVLVVLLNPARRPLLPSSAEGIIQRLNEISFTSALFSELQGIALAKEHAERDRWAVGTLERRLKRLRLHTIEAPEVMGELDAESRMDTSASFVQALFEEGRAAAQAWLGPLQDRGDAHAAGGADGDQRAA